MLFASVVGEVWAAHRMHPDRQVKFRHASEQRPELGQAERLSGNIGEYLDATRAQFAYGTVGLGECGLHVVHRQCGDESRKGPRVLATNVCECVVGNTGKLWRRVRWAHQFKRWIRKRKNLLNAIELVEKSQARFHIDQCRESGEGLDSNMVGNQVREAIEVRLR